MIDDRANCAGVMASKFGTYVKVSSDLFSHFINKLISISSESNEYSTLLLHPSTLVSAVRTGQVSCGDVCIFNIPSIISLLSVVS